MRTARLERIWMMTEAPYALLALIDNDERLYNIRRHADKQLALKKARGVYDRERARSAYTGLVELIAKDAEKALADYEERTPRPWHVAWSKAERTATEKELVARFENAWANPKSAEHTELLKALPKQPDLFIGVYSTGISYADKSREVHGDYARCAFLDYATLTLKFQSDCPPGLRAEIARDAAKIQARRGEQFSTDSSGHTVTLGSQRASAAKHESGNNPSVSYATRQKIDALLGRGKKRVGRSRK
jgi:hypothetical protein